MKKNNKIWIVVPSYNEVQNLEILLKRIDTELAKSSIVIVDDSKLSENKKLKQIVKNKKNVTLISRFKKAGRGSAVLEGFKYALKDKQMSYVFEMDSDLAHDPKEFKRFFKKVDKGYGLIIGSRYLPGGKIINIAPNRTIMSRVINKFLYYWLGMHLSDHTSGFRLYSRQAAEFLTNAQIQSKGFIALSETAYKLFLAGFTIAEVPITWNYRLYGKSNVNLKELYISLISIIKMRIKKD
jgi:dolichol-phosphate mannosyltransferase